MRCEAPRLLGILAALAVALFGAGCGDRCTRNSDCDEGLICGPVGGCVVPPDAAPGGDGGTAIVDAAPGDDGGDATDATPPIDAAPPEADAAVEPEPDAGF